MTAQAQSPIPPVPRPSSTVVLVRPSESGWQTYLTRRSAQSASFASFWVFPGGTIQADDFKLAEHEDRASLSSAAAHLALARPPDLPPESPGESLAYFVCAARELFEEAGVLLARPAPTSAQLTELRDRVRAGESLADAAQELGAALALDALTFYGHWITPLAAPARFDTRFFLAALPEGQAATPDGYEVLEGRWLSPEEAFAESKAERLPLHFATFNHLKRLARYASYEAVLDFAHTKPIAPVLPTWDAKSVPSLPPDLKDAW